MSTSENTLQFLTVDSTIVFCVASYSSSKSEIDRGSALFLSKSNTLFSKFAWLAIVLLIQSVVFTLIC